MVVGKACSCNWGFGLKWLIPMKMVVNPKDEEEEGVCWLTSLKEKELEEMKRVLQGLAVAKIVATRMTR